MNRFAQAVLAGSALVALAGCALGGPRHYAQRADSATNACLGNPLCYTQTGNEAILPWLSHSLNAARAGATLMAFLEQADVKLVEQVLVQCAKDAHHEIDDQEFGKGKLPTAEQCREVVRQENGKDVTRAMELGRKKHAVALECVRRNLGERLLRNVTLQPRYKYDPSTSRWRMLAPMVVAQWLADGLFELLRGTLAPDIVLHATGNPDKVQRVYDYKFPCLSSRKAQPQWRYSSPNSSRQPGQQEKYGSALGGERDPALISPQFGLQ